MPDSLSRLCLALGLLLPALAQQNVTLSSTDSNIIYNPPLCPSFIANCTSPWHASNDTVPGTTVIYTDGPIPQAGYVIPQMFLDFRASALYFRTAPCSNATVNFTLTAEPSNVFITSQVNSSIAFIIAVDIPETQTTTLGITFVPEDHPTKFAVELITLTVANASATSSFLPSATLPISSSPPIFVPTVSSSPTSAASNDKGTIIGAVLGSVLGTLSLVIVFLLIYRYRKRRTPIPPSSSWMEWDRRRHRVMS